MLWAFGGIFDEKSAGLSSKEIWVCDGSISKLWAWLLRLHRVEKCAPRRGISRLCAGYGGTLFHLEIFATVGVHILKG